VACHRFALLERIDVLERAAPGARFLLNSPWPASEVFDHLPREVQEQILEKGLELFVVDADRVAREVGMGGRINTVMQPCFFALAGVLPADQALAAIRASIEKAYAKRGPAVVKRNLAAVDRALEALEPVKLPARATSELRRPPPVPPGSPDFVRRVTAQILAGFGDRLPVSALPADGTFPTGTARYEKRAIAHEIPLWDPALCIDCGKCAMACPHAAVRMKVYAPAAGEGAPEGFLSKPFRSRDLPEHLLTIQVAPGAKRRRSARRSTWRRRRRTASASARPSTSSSGFPSSTRVCSIPPRSSTHRRGSRCSSSRVPAPAAERRLT
jgi:pyruvate-ferredoxin/flavodoxin oxidoreductase